MKSAAKDALVTMGAAVVPVLMDVAARANTGQDVEQISALVREIQLTWDRPSKVPSWWAGSKKGQ